MGNGKILPVHGVGFTPQPLVDRAAGRLRVCSPGADPRCKYCLAAKTGLEIEGLLIVQRPAQQRVDIFISDLFAAGSQCRTGGGVGARDDIGVVGASLVQVAVDEMPALRSARRRAERGVGQACTSGMLVYAESEPLSSYSACDDVHHPPHRAGASAQVAGPAAPSMSTCPATGIRLPSPLWPRR